MRPKKPIVIQNPNVQKNIEGVVDQQNPSYTDSKGRPRDARVLNALSGSGLMREDASRIKLLFPLGDFSSQQSGDPNFGAGVLGKSIANGALETVNIAGEGIQFFYSTETGGPSLFFRLSRNSVPVTDWIPVARLGSYGQPVSPIGASSMFQAAMLPGAREPLYRIAFTRVEIANVKAGGAAARCNAFVIAGGGDID